MPEDVKKASNSAIASNGIVIDRQRELTNKTQEVESSILIGDNS